MTANLVAPLVINQKNRLAKQVVLTSAEYDTKHSLISSKNKKISG
jgi:flagellar assembly factor FliW